ncbi:hypothetical protein RGQ15_07025 [Paracoccus sp. MBLB3053]|uniref:Uncharacterized protein n=1 Tax=Paracoccus aurantius TaxID=3073814 RepID=A0ABU2HRY6_9RHOB|nr:hypothetical protein [Paracoccus sp. MBLB3053]MDS9467325.1 hypothetical protein [Paracoccus sp. MBLB3053]
MNTAHRLEFSTDADGYPQACFAWGEVPPETITAERIAEAASYYAGLGEDALALEELEVQSHWIRQADPNFIDGDGQWQFCAEADPGATRITGVRFS